MYAVLCKIVLIAVIFGPDLPLLYCTEFGQLILKKIIKIVATRCQILRLKCTKFDFGWAPPETPLAPGELTALPQTS